jgi:hypothetical protein
MPNIEDEAPDIYIGTYYSFAEDGSATVCVIRLIQKRVSELGPDRWLAVCLGSL